MLQEAPACKLFCSSSLFSYVQRSLFTLCRGFPNLKLSTLLRQHPRLYDGRKISVVERYVTEIDPQLAQYKDSKVSATMVPLELFMNSKTLHSYVTHLPRCCT